MASTKVVTPAAMDAPSLVLTLLAKLHKESLDEETALSDDPEMQKLRAAAASGIDQETQERHRAAIMRDKYIALDTDKAAFMYNLLRATNALNVVEAGTSYGVSTIYLALAIGQNATAMGKTTKQARVIATEHEPEKAAQARRHWHEAGDSVEPWIDLREGDLRETLKRDVPTIDFVLMDIWTPMVVPTLEILQPRLRPGAVILCDNTTTSASGYADFFAKISAPESGFKTVTLPFAGGLEMVTYWPKIET